MTFELWGILTLLFNIIYVQYSILNTPSFSSNILVWQTFYRGLEVSLISKVLSQLHILATNFFLYKYNIKYFKIMRKKRIEKHVATYSNHLISVYIYIFFNFWIVETNHARTEITIKFGMVLIGSLSIFFSLFTDARKYSSDNYFSLSKDKDK